jgi:hypothetical protein
MTLTIAKIGRNLMSVNFTLATFKNKFFSMNN